MRRLTTVTHAMASPSVSTFIDLASRAGMIGVRRVPTLTAAIARWGPTMAAARNVTSPVPQATSST